MVQFFARRRTDVEPRALFAMEYRNANLTRQCNFTHGMWREAALDRQEVEHLRPFAVSVSGFIYEFKDHRLVKSL